jgi:hypothetical protein
MKVELESHAAIKTGSSQASKSKTNERFDKKGALPVKEGKPDQELYATFPEKSLRRRLWDAVVAGKCTRCSGPHLRVACPKPRQGWEDDFEKEDFFTKPPPAPKPQVRVQFASKALKLPAPQILSVMSPLGRCLVDTCSDVSIARRDVLTGVQRADDDQTILVGHLGGETLLYEMGSFEMSSFDGSLPVVLTNVYVVEPEMLPAGVVSLLGVSDIRHIGLSLDAVMQAPGSPWEHSVRSSFVIRIRRAFRRCFGFGPPPESRIPLQNAHLGAPPERRTTAPAPLGPPPEHRLQGRVSLPAPPPAGRVRTCFRFHPKISMQGGPCWRAPNRVLARTCAGVLPTASRSCSPKVWLASKHSRRPKRDWLPMPLSPRPPFLHASLPQPGPGSDQSSMPYERAGTWGCTTPGRNVRCRSRG